LRRGSGGAPGLQNHNLGAWRGQWVCQLTLFAASALLTSASVSASSFLLPSLSDDPPPEQDVTWLVILLLVLFSTFTVILHLLGRRKWTQREGALAAELAQAHARLDRANLLLSTEPQIVIAWRAAGGEPEIEGELSLVTDAPLPRRVLGFASWLAPELAQRLDQLVEKLRSNGEGFELAAASSRGRFFEIDGRAVSGRAVMRIRDVSGDRLQLVRLRQRFAETSGSLATLRAMLDAISSPVWTREATGQIAWVNAAYVRAVEGKDAADVVARNFDLFDRETRNQALSARLERGVWREKAPALAGGLRKTFDVVEVGDANGAAGIASDLSEIDALRGELERQINSHARTLDQLSTAVAIFDRKKRLVFYNSAYRQIWQLDAGFLDSQPTDGEVLDRLRSRRLLPEQADFRSWKAHLMSAYQATDPVEQVWHLPDGRTLRAVTSPNKQGGVTYLFDDSTQSFSLASQVNALTRVQGETLDMLKEGVAVFGADGRLKLINPAFAALWRFDESRAESKPHIDDVARLCAPLFEDATLWSGLRAVIVGLPEDRHGYSERIERKDGIVLDCAATPLPDGATLLTFVDVTAGANIERALTERNYALVRAEKLRNDFVHHVSYELRTPLTNIIGFAQLLAEGVVGPLNEKQLEYTGYVTKSSAALLAIINDILDLASIDAGALDLRPEEVDVAEAMRAAAEGIQDRLTESSIELRIVATDGVGSLLADGRRIRQILFNLLSNAIGFSAPGQRVTLAAMRRGDEIVFKVSDRGRGIPPEMLDKVFERFETHTGGSRHRGPGLGLSIVRALVQLHGGRVLIDSALSEGTTVTCIFPVAGAAGAIAAVA
jgi:signal transduction histidine kinase